MRRADQRLVHPLDRYYSGKLTEQGISAIFRACWNAISYFKERNYVRSGCVCRLRNFRNYQLFKGQFSGCSTIFSDQELEATKQYCGFPQSEWRTPQPQMLSGIADSGD
ncbi:hypothetical protein ETAA8_13930 [Anatilimnocola aggregata]|uniref:Uncharacterized protein n=1 Tax=Anatilimnocola aggregata TaxID=2528021 RepID=A0A517Y7X6_9BACT|nr:hypothetical protein ETAA8_13930 [Anatilimnocola aggregata]